MLVLPDKRIHLSCLIFPAKLQEGKAFTVQGLGIRGIDLENLVEQGQGLIILPLVHGEPF